jgi:glycogen debranching enzyme
VGPFRAGLLDEEAPVFLAGESYDEPWTRDASINVWNGANLFEPDVSRNTLLAVLERRDGELRIGGEYWDSIVWAPGAWALYLATGDRDFLALTLEATRNSLRHLERTELSETLGLFRGGAVYADGIAAYPDAYAEAGHHNIMGWRDLTPGSLAHRGEGLPMHALSTNCAYVHAYELATAMASELGVEPDARWTRSATDLREAIERHFWLPERGHYRYLVDPLGGSDVQEGFGHAFAILFGIADEAQRDSILRSQHVTPAGLPCLWPPFSRYARDGHVGRHSGTVWPPIQAFWAEAAARAGRADLVGHELDALARHAVRDGQFYELYHPETGLPYGGLQERAGAGVELWEPVAHQTWSATGFLRIVLTVLAGLRLAPDGLSFEPLLPPGLDELELTGVRYRAATVDLHVARDDGPGIELPFVPADATGRHRLELVAS